MTDTAELTHLDESILKDECKCEVKHTVTVCSYEVTHIFMCCEFQELSCWNAIKGMIERTDWKHRRSLTCALCGKPAEHCWSIRPV